LWDLCCINCQYVSHVFESWRSTPGRLFTSFLRTVFIAYSSILNKAAYDVSAPLFRDLCKSQVRGPLLSLGGVIRELLSEVQKNYRLNFSSAGFWTRLACVNDPRPFFLHHHQSFFTISNVIAFTILNEARKRAWFSSEKRNRQRESGSSIRFPFGGTTGIAQH